MTGALRRKRVKDEIPLSFSRRAELKKRTVELSENGLVLGDIRMGQAPNRFSMCLIRAILVFMAVLGTVGGIVSAFSLPFSLPVVLISFAILSICSAFLYYNKITFYTGYVLVFLGFVIFSFRFFWYINSGYQAFMNEVYNQYSDFFHLLSVREAAEFITNRYYTVTAAMIFIGWFFSILLNITIAGYMNLVETFLLTFLPLQIAFYIDLKPGLPYLILLLAVYISVAVLQRSGNYTLPFRHHKSQHFETRRRRKNVRHLYLASSHGMLRITAGAVMLSTVFLLIFNTVFSGDFSTGHVSNPVKDKTDQYVKAAVQNGLTSLLNRYHATGGLAHGKLGGVGSVNPDFETDLKIRYVPYAMESLYLKAYTGITYQNNVFSDSYRPLSEDAGQQAEILPDEITATDTYAPMLTGYNYDPSELSSEPFYGKMWIENIDADARYVFRPYYSFDTTKEQVGAYLGISDWYRDYAAQNFEAAYDMYDSASEIESFDSEEGAERYEVLYLPYQNRLRYAPNPTITEEYEKYVYDTCTGIPQELSDVLEEFWTSELGEELYDATQRRAEQLEAATTEEERFYAEQDYRLRVALMLKYYFIENFRYTMAPGATPVGRDTIEFFLTTQKRGYCAHFASSSALLLRHLGIPTRYVEGYMVTASDIADSMTVSPDIEGWQFGESGLEQTALVEIDVPDASAHAWIEFYIDGYGWIPYEMTPPSSDDDTAAVSGGNFFAFLSNLITPTERDTGDTSAAESADTQQTDSNRKSFLNSYTLSYLLRPLLWLAGAFVLFLVLAPLLSYLRERLQLKKLLRAGHYSDALLLHYHTLLNRLRAHHLLTATNLSIRESMEQISGLLAASSDDAASASQNSPAPDVNTICDLLWSAAYGADTISETDYRSGREMLTGLFKTLSKKKNFTH